MKNLLLVSVLVLTATCPASDLSAQSVAPGEIDLPILLSRRVAVGMTRGELTFAAGVPDVKLDAHVWVYWEFRAREVPADKNHDALLVVFKGERVAFFKFTASEPVRAFIARQQAIARNSVAAK